MKLLNIIFSFTMAYALLGLLGGRLDFWVAGGGSLVRESWWLPILGLAVFALLLLAFQARKRKNIDGVKVEILYPEAFLLVFGLYLLTDAISRPFSFFLHQGVRLDLLLAGVVGAFILWKSRAATSDTRHSKKWFLLLLLLQFLVAATFLDFADGRLIFSDDHPPFLYRVVMLQEHFPWIPFYNTDWNAGYSAHEFFPSGVLNFYFLSLPILGFAGDLTNIDNAAVYTLLIPYIFIFLVPFSLYGAAKLLGLDNRSASFAAIFSIGPSTGFFEFMLKYGTMGFSVSVGLTPLAIACIYRLAISEELPRWRHAFYLLLSASLVMTWSLSFLFLIPASLFGLRHFRTVFSKQRSAKVLVFILLFVLINGPWMMIFVKESKVFSFLSGNTLPGSTSASIHSARERSVETPQSIANTEAKGFLAKAKNTFKKETNRFREILSKVNPVLVFLFLPGLAFFPSKRAFWIFSGSIFWLWLLAATGNLLKPQLEFHRMIIPASFLMCVPAGAAVSELLSRAYRALGGVSGANYYLAITYRGVCATLVVGALVLSPLVAGAAYVNRSDEKYIFAPKEARTLSDTIKKHGGAGRTFFLGFILQELGAQHWSTQDGGHVAILPAFSGKPMYAIDYYHRRWSTVDPIPESYRRRSTEGIEEFLDLVNATAVVTFKREWADYCLRTPGYRQVYFQDRFRVFVREHSVNSYFLKGSGKVLSRAEGFRVFPESKESVIKFRYLPRLGSNPAEGVEIYPVFAFTEEIGGGKFEDVYYVGLRVSPEILRSGKGVVVGFWPDKEL